MNYIYDYINTFFELLKEMAPYLILGFLFAGILHVIIRKDKIQKYLGKRNIISILNAALLGIPLPLCSCGVIPTGISFNKNGASKGATISFLISTPQTGVDSILVTYSLLGLPFAVIRPIISLVTGLLGGVFTNLLDKDEPVIEEIKPQKKTASQSKGAKIKDIFRYAFVDFLKDIAGWLTAGLFIAALIAVVIPDNFFAEFTGSNSLIEMGLMLLMSVPLYVCATASVPIAAVLLMKGVSPGAAIVFLMAGPATNAATMTVIGNALGKKSLAAYLSSVIAGAIGFGLLVNHVLPVELFKIGSASHGHIHSELLPEWFEVTCAIVLSSLIIYSFISSFFKKKSALISKKEKDLTKIRVEGMTCNHCKNSVESNLIKIEGVEKVEAAPSANSVEIHGNKYNMHDVEKTITSLGFKIVKNLKARITKPVPQKGDFRNNSATRRSRIKK